MKTLFLFVTSERPDQYVNSICHCAHSMNVERVVFLHVVGLGRSGEMLPNASRASRSAQIQKLVHTLFDALCSGDYLAISPEDRQRERLSEDGAACDQAAGVYRDCFARIRRWDNEDIGYLALPERMGELASANPNSLFDITSVSKDVLGDLVAVCLTKNISNLHALALRVQPRFKMPAEMLFHALVAKPEPGYEYINILETAVFTGCARSIFVRRMPLSLAIVFVLGLHLVVSVVLFFEGASSPFLQWISALSSAASLSSLVFVFRPPRA